MIIDCFLFFDELDLLEIRLNELSDVVDVFVLTESPVTFTGIEKPLYFEKNQKRYSDFNVINTIYVPEEIFYPTVMEKNQKQYNLDSAFRTVFMPGDIIIQGDCDEIPKAEVIKKAYKDDWQTARLTMPLFYYWLNCRAVEKKLWKNSIMSRPTGRYEYNAKQNDKTDKVYWDSGWHFSFMSNIKAKLAAWGHAPEYNKPPFNTPEHIEKCKEQGLELFMRNKITFEFLNDLSYLPRYVLDNLDRFSRYIAWTQP